MTKPKWDNILFDLDGTLTDPGEGITGSVRHAMEQMGFAVPAQDVLESFIGPPLDEGFSAVCGFSDEEIDQAVQHFRTYFSHTGHKQNKLFAGVPQMLALLQQEGRRLYLATSKPLPLAIEVLERFDLMEYFHLVVGSDINHNGRKKAEVVQEVLQRGDIDPATAVMVGDRRHDVAGAHANGVPCVGVLFGYGSQEEFEQAGADYIARDIPHLQKILLQDA